MSNNNLSKSTENFPADSLDWKAIQLDMKNKLGNDVYESWLRKIDFVEELKNYVLLSVSTRFITRLDNFKIFRSNFTNY